MKTQLTTLRHRPFSPFNLLLSDFNSDHLESLGSQTDYHLHETDQAYFVSLDMPGVKPGDFTIDLTAEHLKIISKRERPFAKEGQREIHFEKNFLLPKNIDRDGVQAHYENGVLFIAIAKTRETKARKIDVHFGEKTPEFARLLGNE